MAEKETQPVERLLGWVAQYFPEKGFGFILPDQPLQRLFFHIKDVKDARVVARGTRVEFEFAIANEKARAINVVIL